MSVRFLFSEEPRRLVAHWCFALPPGIGLIDSLTILFRGLMQPPRLRLYRDRIELFSDCPALALPRRLLSSQSQEMLNDIERQEALTRCGSSQLSSHFGGYRGLPGGDFCLFDFDGDERLTEMFDPSLWIETLTRALWEGGENVKPEVIEACRAALINALFEEPVPRRPPNVVEFEELERRHTKAVEAETERGEVGPAAPLPPAPARKYTTPRFMKPIPRPPASKSDHSWNRFGHSDVLERELEEARETEKIYLRACDLRRFTRSLIERMAQW